MKWKIIYVITGLKTGGAEMMLLKLLSRLNRSMFEPTVISLASHREEGIAQQIESLGIPVYFIDMKPGQFSFSGFLRLVRLLRRIKPNILQGWMHHGNLIATLAGYWGPYLLVWNVRQTLYYHDLYHEDFIFKVIIWLLANLSKRPKSIIYNAHSAANQHESVGFDAKKRFVIPNGFDCELFRPDLEAFSKIRDELQISKDSYLIGLVARYDPMKDHCTFLQAAALLREHVPTVRFLLVGRNIEWNNIALSGLIKELGLMKNVYLLGERQDIPAINAALDIASSSSYSEGFSNSIGEAMSCSVPSVVTDVGDSAWIVGDTGKVVPPRNPIALANAWRDLIEMGTESRQLLGEKARQRVIENFSLDAIVRQYEMLYRQIYNEAK